ncbi:MAG: tetratricopeptide repeat protein [Polyangiaceae bacterium]|nr:tetratricopeptide repeat protein [Polyangiaceae bacterium]
MSRTNQTDDKVIHVVFGPGGGRWDPSLFGRGTNGTTNESFTDENRGVSSLHAEALSEAFTKTEVSNLIGLSLSKLRTLDKAGIVVPSGKRKGRRAYSFTDMIALRAAKALFDQKVRLRDVTRAIYVLRQELPKIESPLTELQVVTEGGKIVVRTDSGKFEPVSRQLVLDLEVAKLQDDIVRVLRPAAGRRRVKAAYELYLHASELDEDQQTMDEAIELYKKALELDPWLAIAYTNLGNIAFRRQNSSEAEAYYSQALDLDDRQPEAQYNLGYLMLERGEPRQSIAFFLGALEADPQFADAYFNLAMAYEQTGQPQMARPLWQSYIALEPQGTWSDIARRHL